MSERVILKDQMTGPKEDGAPSQERKDISSLAAPFAHDVPFLQTTIGNRALYGLFKAGVLQTKLEVGGPDDLYEQEADRVAGQVTENRHAERPNLSAMGTTIQRAPAEGGTATTTPPAETTQPPASTTTALPEEAKTPTPGLIVDDSAVELLPGQMKKSAFLAQLRTAVCDTAEIALSGTIWSAMGCPWIDYWFGYYSGRDSQSIERAIQRYTGAAGITSAADYIPIICSRVRFAIEAWRTTGEVKGVPEGVPGGMPGTASLSEESSPTATPGPISFKAREGNTGKTTDPAAVQARLDTGSPLDSGIRSQMETAFGQDFSGVRVHTDTKAGTLSEDLNARAFTVGRDIAFASGEYQPGTLIGDALIAHELAHVVQQGGGTATAPMQKGDVENSTFEQEANTSALGAMVSLWGDMKTGFANIARNAMPRLKSGLRLQRCRKKQETPVTAEKEEDDLAKKIGIKEWEIMRTPETSYTVNVYPGGTPVDAAEMTMPGLAKKRPGVAIGVKSLRELLMWIKKESKKRKAAGLPHQIEAMTLLGHGNAGEFAIGDYMYTAKTLKDNYGSDSVSEYVKEGALIIFDGCNAAAGAEGKVLMEEFGRIFFGSKKGKLRGNTCVIISLGETTSCKPVEFQYPEMKKFTAGDLLKGK